jgi:predicted nuclease of predicted toxin-antitoxin system
MKKRCHMADLYANENFPLPAVRELRVLGHDVLTSRDAGTANQRVPDPDVLQYATTNNRAVLTHNRGDFKRLHRVSPQHAGIVICTRDADFTALAQRIDQQLRQHDTLAGKLISVTRPS